MTLMRIIIHFGFANFYFYSETNETFSPYVFALTR